MLEAGFVLDGVDSFKVFLQCFGVAHDPRVKRIALFLQQGFEFRNVGGSLFKHERQIINITRLELVGSKVDFLAHNLKRGLDLDLPPENGGRSGGAGHHLG